MSARHRRPGACLKHDRLTVRRSPISCRFTCQHHYSSSPLIQSLIPLLPPRVQVSEHPCRYSQRRADGRCPVSHMPELSSFQVDLLTCTLPTRPRATYHPYLARKRQQRSRRASSDSLREYVG